MSGAALAPEDQARANLYALLARLFYAPPDRELLAALARSEALAAEEPDSALAGAWRDLMAAAAVLDPEAAREEYESVFVGTGKAEVTLYTGAYTIKSALDNPLLEIREYLAKHGFVRRENVFEPEDHVAALCETMRYLVSENQDDARQRQFFATFLWPAAGPLCDAMESASGTNFYKHVARLAKYFFAVEHSAFGME
jgi:TorA maturation chaperone TorD